MKCLRRNLMPFWYSTYLGESELLDKDGYETGEKTLSYTDPVEVFGNISHAMGGVRVAPFGNDVQYDKVIVVDDPSCGITEDSVLFVNCLPSFDSRGYPLYDYVVKRVARSLNSVSVAIAKVKVS